MYKKAAAVFAVMLSSGLAHAQGADAKAGWYGGLDLGAGRAGVSEPQLRRRSGARAPRQL